jgi:hypothetical protein
MGYRPEEGSFQKRPDSERELAHNGREGPGERAIYSQHIKVK